MVRISDIENFLALVSSQDGSEPPFTTDMTSEQKTDWILANPHDTYRIIRKMRGVGDTTVSMFLEHHKLVQVTRLIKKEDYDNSLP